MASDHHSPAIKNRAAVVGWPVSHSLSPRLHGYWLQQYAIDGEYTALAAQPEELPALLKKLVSEAWRGFNLTLPHKEAVMPFLDSVDETAKAIGSVNTVIIENGKLHGRNTDAYGFWENIRPLVGKKNKAVILGAGGAARAVVYALRLNGFSDIVLLNRSRARAEALASGKQGVFVGDWDARSSTLTDTDLLVNTTSLGMAGKEALEINLSALPPAALVNDIVYTPLQTALLKQAQLKGSPTVDGLGMLLHQAVPAFEAWFGIRPEVTDALRKHILGT